MKPGNETREACFIACIRGMNGKESYVVLATLLFWLAHGQAMSTNHLKTKGEGKTLLWGV